MCDEAFDEDPWNLAYVPDHLKTQEMFNKAIDKFDWNLESVPDHFKNQEMCDKAFCLFVKFV